tara:strand:- start:6155 stop:6379 length:225 start_codon:yes stop_codon:yes gene_type:complete
MASDLYNVMTHAQAVDFFNAEILPTIKEQYEQDGVPDLPARREEWNNWTDSLCKDEQISDWQYDNWTQPDCCEG